MSEREQVGDRWVVECPVDGCDWVFDVTPTYVTSLDGCFRAVAPDLDGAFAAHLAEREIDPSHRAVRGRLLALYRGTDAPTP